MYDKIDANGLASDSLFEDSHIWKLIKKIENCDKEDYLKLKRNLLKSLSLKLDYDWRCSERDIKGEPAKIVSLIMLLLAMCFATYEVYRLEPMQTDIPTLLVDVVPIMALFLFATTVLKLCKKYAVKTVGDIAILAGVLIAAFFIHKEQLTTQYPYICVALVFIFFAAGINLLIVFNILLDDFFYIRDIKKQLIENKKS